MKEAKAVTDKADIIFSSVGLHPRGWPHHSHTPALWTTNSDLYRTVMCLFHRQGCRDSTGTIWKPSFECLPCTGSFPSTPYMSFILPSKKISQAVILLSTFYHQRKWGTEALVNLSWVTQLQSERTGFEPRSSAPNAVYTSNNETKFPARVWILCSSQLLILKS
jgi:hypothetical protein